MQVDAAGQVFLHAVLAEGFADDVFEFGDALETVDDGVALGRDGPVVDEIEELGGRGR